MLKIIDSYLLRKFLGTFFFVCLMFTLIAVVIDFSEKLDNLTEKKAPSYEILHHYYLRFIPYINGMLWPLFAFIAVIFFTSRLAYNNEFIAMLGTGARFRRLAVPYLFGSILIAGLHFTLNHTVIPDGNKLRTAFENKYIWTQNIKSIDQDIHMNLSATSSVYIEFYNIKDSTGRNFSLEHFNDEGQIVYKLSASEIRNLKSANRWGLINCRILKMDGLKETLTKVNRIDTTFAFSPGDFARRDNFKETMNSRELRRFIRQEKVRGSESTLLFEVELHRRTADAFSIVVLTMLGFAVAARKSRGGMGWQLLFGLSAGALYIFLVKFSSVLSTNAGVQPLLGVWIPNILFGGLTIFMLAKAQR